MTQIEDLKPKLSGAKTALVVDNAFIASLLCSQKVTWDDKLVPPTMVTDGHMITACPKHVAKLSAQELRVLALVADGRTNKEIGTLMGLSPKTVKNYLGRVFQKLQVSRRSEAAARFVRGISHK